MPEHVHLVVYPESDDSRIERLLKAVKQPFSNRIKRLLLDAGSPLLDELTVRERPGKMSFRFWQEGPGYDRNLKTPRIVLASIDYLHSNPVRRGLVGRGIDWRWSSCRFYHEEAASKDEALPTIHGLPPEFWDM